MDGVASDPDRLRLAFVAALSAGDVPTACDLAVDLLDHGVPIDRVVLDYIVPVQAEFGRRWESGDMSVAEEHAATAAFEQVLAFLAGTVGPVAPAGTVAVASAEGDDHGFPLRLVATILSLRDWDVVMLGTSVPPAHLERFLADRAPRAVLLGCSVVVALPGLRRSVAAAHRAGVPVIAGGGGCGPDGRWALALGADAYAPDATAPARILATWTPDPVAAEAAVAAPPAEVERLRAERAGAVHHAMRALADAVPDLEARDTEQRAWIASEVGWLAQATEAALLVHDRDVLQQFASWQRATLRAQGIDDGTADALVPALQRATETLELSEATAILASLARR